MPHPLLFLCLVLAACSRPQLVNRKPLDHGQCYYYHRSTKHPHAPFTERLNPFWFRHPRAWGKDARMRVYVTWRGSVYTDTVRQREKQLIQYGTCVPCSTVDSLSRLAQKL